METTSGISAKKRRMNDEFPPSSSSSSSSGMTNNSKSIVKDHGSTSGKASSAVNIYKKNGTKKETSKVTAVTAKKGKTVSKAATTTTKKKGKVSTSAVGGTSVSHHRRTGSQERTSLDQTHGASKKGTTGAKRGHQKTTKKTAVAKKKKRTEPEVSRSKKISKKPIKKQLVEKVVKKKKITAAMNVVKRGKHKNVGIKGKGGGGGKGFGFWRGSRLRRMASLNAQAKVHILYEKEARNVVVGGSGASDEGSNLGGGGGLKTSTTSSSASESVSLSKDKSKTTAKISSSSSSVKQKRRIVDDPNVYAIAPKRMASLNAQAILAASYSMDRSRTKDKTAKMMASIESVVAASMVDDDDDIVSQKNDTVMDVINAVASEGFLYDRSSDNAKDFHEFREEPKKGKRKNNVAVPLKMTKTRTIKNKMTTKKTKVASKDDFIEMSPKKRSTSKTSTDTLVIEGLLSTRNSVDDDDDGVPKSNDRNVGCGKELEPNAKTISSPSYDAEESLPDKVDVKAEAIRRDKIEDTAEVTITGMYVNPVTNTSQSFCISRIHTYKQATSTRSYSPSSPSGPPPPPPHPSLQLQQQPPSSHHGVVNAGTGTTNSGGGMIHGVHHHGSGLYPYTEHICPAEAMGGVPLMDVALSRHYGSAFTVPHYGIHNPLSYPPPPPTHTHGYYQPAGPMIQSLSDSCLIHKPVAFHPFPGDRCQSQSGPPPQPQQPPHQPFPVESCHTHQTTPYPPTGPGPGGQQQVYAGGGIRVSSPSSSIIGPPITVSSSSSSSSSNAAAAAAVAAASSVSSSSSNGQPQPPISSSTTGSGVGGGGGRSYAASVVVVATAAAAAAAASTCLVVDNNKCKPAISNGNIACPPPSSTSEHYFTDGCQSCAAIAAAAAAVVAGCQSADQFGAPNSVQQQQQQHYSARTSGNGNGGSGPPPPPPPPPTPAITQFIHAREHLQLQATVNGGSATDPYGRLPPTKPDVGLQNAALPTQTKTVKVEANDPLLVGSDLEVDGGGGGGFIATSTLLPSNPSIAAAAKTPKNGRQPHHLHNKSSPPSADVVSVANEQSTMHHYLRPKEARLTVSLEDVFRNTSSTDHWIASSLQHRLQALHVNGKQDSGGRCRRRNNGLRTRSKTLEITGKKYMIQTRSCNNILSQRRAKLGIRDVTNEKRSLLMTATTYEEQKRSSSSRFQSSLVPYPMSGGNGRQSHLRRLSCSRGPNYSEPNVPVQYHVSRSTETSKGPSTRRHLLPATAKSHDIVEAVPRQQMMSRSSKGGAKKFPRYSNGWTWEGTPFRKAVYLHNDDPPVVRRCYPSMRHVQGDIIRVRDCILLKSGPRRVDLPYVAKVAALWENPDDGEMMVSLLWYYRPEHTEQGRKPHHMEDEIFASKHRDVNSVACIEDKCHVLTFNEYCRYHSRIRILDEGLRPSQSVVADLEDGYPRKERQPSGRLSTDLVFFCRKVYDFRQKRILKNPS